VNGKPVQSGSFYVGGTTLSLVLPDGRMAVVNCEIKFSRHFGGSADDHRSCRQPVADNAQAEIHGDIVKLEWAVSSDGKKKQSETYKVLVILNKPKAD
jgi:hypothetical protein